MDPALLGTRLAASAVAPLLKKLFRQDGPGAGLTEGPVRLATLVSFRGEKRTLAEPDVRKLAARLVERAAASPGERPVPPGEETAVADALARTLLGLGDLEMDDVQAVRLGHRELARELRARTPAPGHLSADATAFLDSLTELACVHVVHFFTQRSTFVARTLVEQTRSQAELIAKLDELIARNPRPDVAAAAFERRYLDHIAEKHNRITIYGIDLRETPDRWPLEVAYLSLEATSTESRPHDDLEALLDAGPVTVHLPADAALAEHPRVLLRGDAGSGKTTLVQWLAVSTATRTRATPTPSASDRVPFVLPLRTLIRTGTLPSPDAFLTAIGCPHAPPDGWASGVLRAGRGLVLIDGVDEVPAADRVRTRDWLLDLTHAYPANQWLVTSRPTAVRPTWLAERDFRELALAPMKRADVGTFVHRWHTAADAEPYAEQLLSSLRAKRDLARMATNPLMCGLICALHRERRGFLPQSRKSLYDAALSMLLTRRDRERGMGAPDGIELTEEAQLDLLQSLAYGLTLSGRTEMDHDGALLLLERALPNIASAAEQGDAAAVFRHLLLRSGLLREPGPDAVDFVHRTFQDYLGARAAVSEGHLDALVSHAGDPQWEDVIRMSVAHARPTERNTLLRKLLSADTGPRVALLALACLDDATSLSPAVREEVEARAAGLIPPRTAAESRALAEAGPLVLELLPGPEGLSDDEALGVVYTASLVGNEFALPVLKRFRDHSDLRVRAHLTSAWDKFDADEYADEVLTPALSLSLSRSVRTRAQAEALRRLGPHPNVSISGAYTASELLTFVDAGALQHLYVLDNTELRDLTPLTSLPKLDRLSLSNCPVLEDLGSLSALELSALHLYRKAEPAHGLKQLTSLRFLTLTSTLNGADLTTWLPASAPLETLSFQPMALGTAGLKGLSQWPTLTYLMLGKGDCELTAADFEEMAVHPGLRKLLVESPLLSEFVDTPELPEIETLYLFELEGTEDLSDLPLVFTGVRRVIISPRGRHHFLADRYAGLFPQAKVDVLNTFWNTPPT
ncbi:NACHT domain-containing protein [Streptomyces aureoverticillatus]|uniref:NACHT domain-containing protein n=1 Tax=Streptomyces aureoverticillatus TaxID=66871 RepID=UPI0013DC7B73|nr:NACHT domain-containing protein [Streptomyces aureoverticillatus]QIB44354.1 NACHT domain-containing protein [Streptomyces aureoverticillatus]